MKSFEDLLKARKEMLVNDEDNNKRNVDLGLKFDQILKEKNKNQNLYFVFDIVFGNTFFEKVFLVSDNSRHTITVFSTCSFHEDSLASLF